MKNRTIALLASAVLISAPITQPALAATTTLTYTIDCAAGLTQGGITYNSENGSTFSYYAELFYSNGNNLDITVTFANCSSAYYAVYTPPFDFVDGATSPTSKNILVIPGGSGTISGSGARQFTLNFYPAAGGGCDLSSLRTLSQGGWSNRSASSPLTSNWFSTNFSSGLKIGALTNSVTLTSADKVRGFLPQSGTPSVLFGGSRTNPTRSDLKNTLAGQATALTLNLALHPTLGDLYLATGYSGTITNLLQEANAALNGTGSPSKSTLTNLNSLLESVNLSFPDGVSNGSVVCSND